MSTDNVQWNLKVLCVIDQLALGGGAEQLLATLVPEIRKRGIDIEVATLIPWTPDLTPALEAQGVIVHRVNAKNLRQVFPILRGLAAITRKGAFDLVWSHQRVAGLLLRVAELHRPASRHIVTLHSEGYAKLRITSLRSRLTLLAERFLLKRTKKIAVSGAVAADYAAYFGWRGIDVIYNGVEARKAPPGLSNADKAAARARFGITSNEFLIVTPARYIEKKGHVYLIEAIAILQAQKRCAVRVLAFGNGPLKGALQQRAEALGANIQFSEAVPHTELFPLIQSADGVVLPSLREPFGIAAAEAMMLGAPVILTRTDGFIEIVGDSDCAIMVPPANGQALADAIWQLSQDPASGLRRAAAAKARVLENFTIEASADLWVQLFMRTAGRGG